VKLLIVSDSPALASGQGRVVRELARRFHRDGHAVAVAGWFHYHAKSDAKFPYPIFHVPKETQAALEPVLDEIKPDTVLAIGDPWDFRWLAAVRPQRRFRLVGYLNVEAEPMAQDLEVVLDAFDVLTTTSEWGARVVGRPGVVGIHHGVDRQVFYPVSKPAEFLGRDLAKTFVVLLNGQNILRKNLAAAIRGFAIFAQTAPGPALCYVNAKMVPESQDPPGANLAELVLDLGVEKIVCFNHLNRGPLDTIDDEAMNATYGLADVLLMPSMGEGFGLPLLEAMATKVVPIATRGWSAHELLADGRGALVAPAASFRVQQGSDVLVVDPADIATALRSVYDAWETSGLESYHRAGLAFAISRPWDRTYERLTEAMEAARPARAANGKSIDPLLRLRARRARWRHQQPFGVLKMGGLGDMLQTTVVVRAAAEQYGAKAVVFCTTADEVFEAMPEVAEVVHVREQPQDQVVRSIADQFDRFLDVRYVSRAYGAGVEPTETATKYESFYRAWASSCARLDTLDRHTTSLMLESLGLKADSIRPIFEPRDGGPAMAEPYLTVATGAGSLGKLKLWPQAAWERLAEECDARGINLVQVGGEQDPPVPSSMDCRGEDLARTAAILAASGGLVAVEGGIVHLAVATSTRAVVIFGPTPLDPLAYSWNLNLSLLNCRPCWWSLPTWVEQRCALGEAHCVNFVDVSDVMTGIEAMFSLLRRREVQA
jgi:glycosyltransferase involved in cell wall biosynthesis/ADP-heptose:LPS heptosyltransferase